MIETITVITILSNSVGSGVVLLIYEMQLNRFEPAKDRRPNLALVHGKIVTKLIKEITF